MKQNALIMLMLYKKEVKTVIRTTALVSLLSFAVGALFGYYCMQPHVTTPEKELSAKQLLQKGGSADGN